MHENIQKFYKSSKIKVKDFMKISVDFPYKTIMVKLTLVRKNQSYWQIFLSNWSLGEMYHGYNYNNPVTVNDKNNVRRILQSHHLGMMKKVNTDADTLAALRSKITRIVNAYSYKASMLGETKLIPVLHEMGIEAWIPE